MWQEVCEKRQPYFTCASRVRNRANILNGKDQNALIAFVWRDHALDHIGARKFKRALKDLKKEATNILRDALFITLLAGVRVLLGEPADALAHLEKAHGLEPGNGNFSRCCGTAWRWMDDCDRALADLSRAIEMKPDHVATLVLRGDTYMLVKEYHEADADLHKAEALTRTAPSYITLAMNGGCSECSVSMRRQIDFS
jgi:tetratricopeptide (TPR) repeat protein